MIKPYYEEPGITIYCGDARNILPEIEQADLICTDPPYGLNYNNGDLASQWENVFGGKKENLGVRPIANDGEDEAMELFEWLCRLSKEKILKGGCCCCCCCCGGGGPKPLFAKWTLLMDKYIGFKQAVVWDKGGLGMGIHYRRNYEFVLIAQNGEPARVWNGGNKTANIWRIPKIIPNDKQHPTQKPVELMSKIIQIHSNPGDLVIDPFMGHGSTLVAAKALKRRVIGIDLKEDYVRATIDRLRQGILL